ncbi:hypothetical protein DM860_002855 [Cuscuta australis]|uniref:Uncharacterized protein n=1 Tax=Cuscuta australis TaxID=267555 RepID=A0A328D0P5_9ASTE|nr:hypothetical protein DM860_002855 [Cuscuta australis]
MVILVGEEHLKKTMGYTSSNSGFGAGEWDEQNEDSYRKCADEDEDEDDDDDDSDEDPPAGEEECDPPIGDEQEC